MGRLSKYGISVIESVAAVVIISFVLITTASIIINSRNQALAAKEEINAIEIGSRIRDNFLNQISYDDIETWVIDDNQLLTNDTCQSSNPPFSCDLLVVEQDGVSYDKAIEVTFYQQSSSDIIYKTISFEISINYYSERTIEIRGVIYDK